MATTFTKIASVTVGSGGASSIDFTSIPSTYTDLCLKVSLRNNRSTATGYPTLKFNSSSSAYSNRELYGTGSAAFSGTAGGLTSAIQFYAVGAGATSNTFGNGDIYIPNYAGANYKSLSVDVVNENNATGADALLLAGLWSNSAAITSITLAPGDSATSFNQYSTATLYGIKNS